MAAQTVSVTEQFSNQSIIVKNIFDEFKKAIFDNIFFTNIGILRTQSTLYSFSNNRWDQRPYMFCYDVYSEAGIYPVILLVNNIKSYLEFTADRFPENDKGERVIIAPSLDTIIKLLNTSSNE